MSRSWLRSSRLSKDRLLIVVPVVIGVLGLVTGLVLAFVVPQVVSDDWSQDAKAASAAAEDFVVTFNTYEASELDDYRERVDGLVTDSLQEAIETNLDEAEPTMVENGQTSSGVSVRSIGVTELDADSATAVVVFTFTLGSQSGQPTGVGARTFVELTREGSDWKVNDYTEIPIASADVSAPDGASPDAASPDATSTPEAPQ